MASKLWHFEQSRFTDSPSRKDGITEVEEQSALQHTANFIQEMGKILELPLLCVNTAVVFMRRFYVLHSLKVFDKYPLGCAAILFASKCEEDGKSLSSVCSAAKLLGAFDEIDEDECIEVLRINERAMMCTMGFSVLILHPHALIISSCELLNSSKDFKYTAYILATYCLHLTNMGLKYQASALACVCIYLASVTMETPIPLLSDGTKWYLNIDPTMTETILEELSSEFRTTIAQCEEICLQKTLDTYFGKLVKNNRIRVGLWGLPIVKSPVKAVSKDTSPEPRSQEPRSPEPSSPASDTSYASQSPLGTPRNDITSSEEEDHAD